jgi:lysophospholipase L1-like esterase
LFLGEFGVRLLAQRDQDNNWYFRGHHLKPYRLPVEKVARFARQLEKDKTVVIANEDLGWVPRPGFARGQAIQDQNGLRAATTERAVDRVPAATNYRIALFGDSFTYGAEVAYEDSWCADLERQLVLPGFQTEVLNFGVSGYGMDQAYLRWKHQGIDFAPQLVVFGLQFENFQRNTNLVRAIYNPRTGLPFAKPRFVLEDDRLRLVNHPCVAPQDLPEVLRNFDKWPWSQHEAHYRAEDYQSRWWQASRLLTFVENVIGEALLAEESDYQANSDDARLCLKIIENFADSVASVGAQFIVLVMPKRKDLEYAMVHGEFPYENILTAAARPLPVVRADRQLLKAAQANTLESLYLRLHYSAKGNQIVAQALVDQLEAVSLTKTPRAKNTAPVGLRRE